ncbi:hypothetical protein BG004_002228 [Podila humilis]|nr:hypothetical protein BG004_002228 [Podila humilis]
MEPTPQHNAIGNQLLAHTIASYLTPPDLAKCLRLCRFWNKEFTPYFFRKLAFNECDSLSRLMTNDNAVKVLRQNMHHVREIDCAEENISSLVTDHPLPNLTCLRMMFFGDYETILLPLLKSSSRMHTFNIVQGYCSQNLQLSIMINDIIHYLPSLRYLHLDWKKLVDQATLAQILCLAAGLEIVRLDMTILREDKMWASSPEAAVAPSSSLSSPSGGGILGMDPQRGLLNTLSETIAVKATNSRIHDDDGSSSLSLPVKELHFSKVRVANERDYPLFITLLRYCHRLEKLALPTIWANRNERSVSVFYLNLISACANTLQYLDVYDSYASGEAIAAVIQKCASLRGFRWGYDQKDSEVVYNALVTHHRTSLEDIDVSGTKDTHTTPAMANGLTMNALIHKILCSFPRLRRFEALVIDRIFWYADHSISSIDLKDSSGCFTDWVCKDLEAISLKFIPGKSYAQFMKQINTVYDREAKYQAPIFPEVLCTQLCRLEKLEKLRLAVDVDLDPDDQQRQDEEDNDDPHMSMGEALSNILGSLKNLHKLELRNMSDFLDKSELNEHSLMGLVFIEIQ